MATVNPIEAELRKATGSKPQGKNESRQGYLARLVAAIGELTDAEWNHLTEPTQTWINAAVKAGKGKLEDFDEEEAEEEAEDETGPEDETEDPAGEPEPEDEEIDDTGTEEEEDAAPRKKTAAKKTAAPKPDKKPVSRKGESGSGEGVKNTIKRLILENPQVSVDDIAAVITKQGVTASRLTISGIRSEFRHTLRFLKSVNALKAKIDI